MQVTIDLEQVASVTTGWFGENPLRLLIVYGVLTAPHGIRLARELIKEVYEDRKKGAKTFGFAGPPHEVMLFMVAPILALTGWATFPFYAVWRVLRVGLGPIPD